MHFLIYIAFLLLAPAPLLPADEPTLQDQILEAAHKSLATRYPDAAAHMDVRLLRTGGQLNENQVLQLHFPTSTALPRAHVQVKVHQQTAGKDGRKQVGQCFMSHTSTLWASQREPSGKKTL